MPVQWLVIKKCEKIAYKEKMCTSIEIGKKIKWVAFAEQSQCFHGKKFRNVQIIFCLNITNDSNIFTDISIKLHQKVNFKDIIN